MTFLDVLVDGEVVKEAMLVDNTEGEEILYKGPNLARGTKNIASFLVGRLPNMNYCIFSVPNRKYIVIPLSNLKYLLLGLAIDVNAEDFIVQIKKTLRDFGKVSDKKIGLEY